MTMNLTDLMLSFVEDLTPEEIDEIMEWLNEEEGL